MERGGGRIKGRLSGRREGGRNVDAMEVVGVVDVVDVGYLLGGQ